MPRLLTLVLWATLVALLEGCAQSYTVPGGPANLANLGVTSEARTAATDHSVQAILNKRPLVTFPATIAIARVQAADYASYTYRGGRNWQGAYSVITARDIEKDDDILAIARLPQVNGVVTLKRILLEGALNSDEQLRAAAARLHANLLLFYTFDTVFQTESRIPPLGVITLGLFPEQNAKVCCTASAVLMDVNNGYVYGVVEATSKDSQLANAWSSKQAMDDVRRRTERDAFAQLLKQFAAEWPVVVATYRPATAP